MKYKKYNGFCYVVFSLQLCPLLLPPYTMQLCDTPLPRCHACPKLETRNLRVHPVACLLNQGWLSRCTRTLSAKFALGPPDIVFSMSETMTGIVAILEQGLSPPTKGLNPKCRLLRSGVLTKTCGDKLDHGVLVVGGRSRVEGGGWGLRICGGFQKTRVPFLLGSR